MAKDRKEPGDLNWSGIYLRREDAKEVFTILAGRPADLSKGDVVAGIIRKHGKTYIAKLKREAGL